MIETYLGDFYQIAKMIGLFLLIPIGRKILKWFGPAILMMGRKPWK